MQPQAFEMRDLQQSTASWLAGRAGHSNHIKNGQKACFLPALRFALSFQPEVSKNGGIDDDIDVGIDENTRESIQPSRRLA